MFGLPAMLLTVMILAASAVVASWAVVAGRIDVVAKVVKLSAVLVAAYMSLLLGLSTGSTTVVLEPGQRKVFCGAYLDCHMGVSIAKMWATDRVVFEQSSWVADGKFLFVDVEVSSDAGSAPLRLRDPEFVLTDQTGRRYERLRHLEFELATYSGQPHSLTISLNPSGSFVKTLVFDIPPDAVGLRLRATDGSWIDRVVELFLIGDEDSLFHRPVVLALGR